MKTTANTTRKSLFAGVAAIALVASGCYVYTDSSPRKPRVSYCPAGCVDGCSDVCEATCTETGCYGSPSAGSVLFGDLSLAWGFEDAASCYAAGVSEIQISVEGIDTADSEWVSLACGSRGATFFGLTEGWYWVRVEGRDAAGCLRYEQELEAEVLGGMVADLGLVVLDAVAPTAPPPPPVAAPGALAIDWAFRYPDADATYDCEYAGVEWVEVNVYDSWGDLAFGETMACVEGPITIDNFDPGRFDVELRGIGLYQGDYIELYRSPVLMADLHDGAVTDLGIVDLDRFEDQFGDFMLDWSFEGYSCAAQGVTDVTVRIIRSDTQIIDDEFTVPCEERPQLRATFVPGDYEIELSAADLYGDCWYALSVVDLFPNTMVSADLWAQLVSCY